jgi:hypothetical protein
LRDTQKFWWLKCREKKKKNRKEKPKNIRESINDLENK